MVKVKYDEFVSHVDKFFSESKEKHSIFFSFKRVFKENFKFKVNKKTRKLRREDHVSQERDADKQYSVLVRAKLRRKKVQTVVEPKDLSSFHNILMKIFSLHFIVSTNDHKPRLKVAAKKKMSNKKRRLLKKKKKLQSKVDTSNANETQKKELKQ